MKPEDYEAMLSQEQARNAANPMMFLYFKDGQPVTVQVPESAVEVVKHLSYTTEGLEKKVAKLTEALQQIAIITASAGCSECDDILDVARQALL